MGYIIYNYKTFAQPRRPPRNFSPSKLSPVYLFSYYVIIIAHFGNPVNSRDIGVLRKNNGRVRDNPTVDWVFCCVL